MKALANDDRMSLRGHLCVLYTFDAEREGVAAKKGEEKFHIVVISLF